MIKKLNLTILIIFQQANNYYFKNFYYLRLSLVTLLALPFDFMYGNSSLSLGCIRWTVHRDCNGGYPHPLLFLFNLSPLAFSSFASFHSLLP